MTIFRPMATLANELELDLIAEGIESLEQQEILCTLGYQWGQGYYFSRPVHRDIFPDLLKNNH